MRTVVALWLAVVACAAPTQSRSARWPVHRKDRDARIEKLERENKLLIEHVERLERDLHTLEARVTGQHADAETPPGPASAAAPSSTSGTP